MEKSYLCIDLKSFYASVECRERGLDPMTANLVVADPERTEKTICLAVSPAMKALGVPGRCRLFEIPKGIEYVIAPPRMKLYIEVSAEIYAVYLKYVSREDIQVDSIDEVFLDVTDYLDLFTIWFRDVLLFKATNDANHLIFKEEIKYIRKEADRTSYEGLETILDALEKAKRRISANVNLDLTMQLLCMTIQEN